MTDDGKGALEVTELTYDGKTELPVFTNTYVKPVEPPKDDLGLMQTGDSTSTLGAHGLLRTVARPRPNAVEARRPGGLDPRFQ